MPMSGIRQIRYIIRSLGETAKPTERHRYERNTGKDSS